MNVVGGGCHVFFWIVYCVSESVWSVKDDDEDGFFFLIISQRGERKEECLCAVDDNDDGERRGEIIYSVSVCERECV